jgi:hypothetical protein
MIQPYSFIRLLAFLSGFQNITQKSGLAFGDRGNVAIPSPSLTSTGHGKKPSLSRRQNVVSQPKGFGVMGWGSHVSLVCNGRKIRAGTNGLLTRNSEKKMKLMIWLLFRKISNGWF